MTTENVEPAAVLEALRVVQDPDLGRDIVSLNFVKNLRVAGGEVSFVIELTTPACPVKEQMHDQAVAAVSALAGVTGVTVDMTANVRAVVSPEAGRAPIPGVKNIIALAPTVRVNCVAPGWIDTEWHQQAVDQETHMARRGFVIKDALLGKVLQPEDVADAVIAFVAHNTMATSQILRLDGGRTG